MSLMNIVHVAVAVIKNRQGQFFIAQRPKRSHQGGLWEFPGGKIESNETVLDALNRELFEEVGITFSQASPLIRIHHHYDDKSVLLDVWCVDEYSGKALGKEGQKTCWIKPDEFYLYDFPVANLPIIQAIQLPNKYMITGAFKGETELLTRVKSALVNGIKLIQFRAHDLVQGIYFEYAEKIFSLCQEENARLLLNTSVENYINYQAEKFSHGLHLNTKEINFSPDDLLNKDLLVATSVHNEMELLAAKQKKVDFVVLSPVNKTLSHPDLIP